MTFNPSRFIASSGGVAQQDPKKIVFGYGRRVCPGVHLAEVSLFLNVAGILATFNISKTLDERGMEVEPLVEYTTGITRWVMNKYLFILTQVCQPSQAV
jgi:cytochrome P450